MMAPTLNGLRARSTAMESGRRRRSRVSRISHRQLEGRDLHGARAAATVSGSGGGSPVIDCRNGTGMKIATNTSAISQNSTLRSYVFLRGDPGNPGPKTDRRFLTCLVPDNKPAPFQHGSGRREMAEAIASRDNPLTARVWVNRVWGHLFGHGLVDTPSDFGVRGTPPTHPELLDTLACDLMDDGWSTKRLIRRIVLSATYRQSSDTPRRVCRGRSGESIAVAQPIAAGSTWNRSATRCLSVAGRLDDKMGGPSVSLTDAPFSTRRSVYGFIERQNLPAFFRTFDFANPNTHTPERPQTTAPQQALFLMNSPFAIEQATFLATRSEKPRGGWGRAAGEPPGTFALELGRSTQPRRRTRVRRINRLFRFALGREPTIDELTDALEFIDRGDPPDFDRDLQSIRLAIRLGHVRRTGPRRSIPAAAPLRRQTRGRAGDKLPDPTLGWVMLNASGGHPGDAAHAAIRRWTAPAAGTLHIEGVLGHAADKGDGVRGRIVASRAGVVGSWDVFHNEAATNPPPIAVQQGDTIDFVTDSPRERRLRMSSIGP